MKIRHNSVLPSERATENTPDEQVRKIPFDFEKFNKSAMNM